MKRKISDIGQVMLKFQEELAVSHKYKPVPINLFTGNVRDKYEENLPAWCQDEETRKHPLYSACGTMISRGYERIVIGDYGAFVEISPDQICKEYLLCKKGQEYRINDPRYAKNVKYHWLTIKDESYCKIYFQIRSVDYADYIPGMYYISPYEVWLN